MGILCGCHSGTSALPKVVSLSGHPFGNMQEFGEILGRGPRTFWLVAFESSAWYSDMVRLTLQGFIGALGTGPTTFWLPSIIWLVLKKPGYTNWNFWASWVCIILGIAVTILGSIGGMRDIIVSASGYKFYQ
jgi:hypothetical protein